MKSNEEILKLEKTLEKLENLNASFDYLRISLASPNRIRSWAERILPNGVIIGEVLKPETINFRTHQPEINGLFCEIIFGPIKNWKCKCGKYNGFVIDKICEECQVEIIEARVRRYRMGYIDLTCPVTHLWYLKGVPNYLNILLKIYYPKLTVSNLENIVYFKERGNDENDKNGEDELISLFGYPNSKDIKNEFEKFFVNNSKNSFKGTFSNNKSQVLKNSRRQKRLGAEIIKAALENLNLKTEIQNARSLVENTCIKYLKGNYIPEKSLIRRIRILESFLATKTNPSWMVLTVLPVLPPNLRPLLELESGRLVVADVNEIYRLIITRNQRLFDFMYHYMAPDIITVHGRRLLQEGVDSLIDNARLAKDKKLALNNKALKSLTEILEGKQGRFRQSLLGKRVDYSGRSVIIVGPNLRLNQCGIPYEMAIELFQPFLINELLKTKIKAPSRNTKVAQLIIKKNKPFVWSLLVNLTKKYSVLLNRAPTLHRFGIQAFDPILILGQAIHLHPLVCTGFNADFDGDQMAIHLPLYECSQLEARTMMRPSYNVLSPSNGEVILKPTQDMVIGSYYLTLMINKNSFPIEKWFSNVQEALSAYYSKKITLHTRILVRYKISSFKVEIENQKFKFLDKKSNLNMNEKEIFIYKIFPMRENSSKFFVISNLGIFLSFFHHNNVYEFTDFFLETTPGRLIFSLNFQNSLKN
uniref:DNA-directed RNA polymerase subunit n=1 Tax=Mallomonas splendens TaxID=52552 RepID=A0A3G2QZF2_9STRA|nr:RNA polymerase beta' subunit [Mallomonas splendens]AYO28506.1 RNA polymerase beta' subunit [Mallomonas splendens]